MKPMTLVAFCWSFWARWPSPIKGSVTPVKKRSLISDRFMPRLRLVSEFPFLQYSED